MWSCRAARQRQRDAARSRCTASSTNTSRTAPCATSKPSAKTAGADVVARVIDLTSKAPLTGETVIIVDTTELGETLREPFYKSTQTPAWPIVLTREPNAGQSEAFSLADVRGAIVAMYESKRFAVAEGISHKSEVASILDHAKRDGDLPRVSLAVGVACHRVKLYGARGPWPGRKPPKPGSEDAIKLASWMELQRELAQAQEDEEEGRWWPRDGTNRHGW